MFKKKQPQQEFQMRNDYTSSEEPIILHKKTIKEFNIITYIPLNGIIFFE